MATTMTNLEKVKLTAAPDQGLVEAGSYLWSASPDYIVQLVPEPDNSQCYAISLGPIGDVIVTASAVAIGGTPGARVEGTYTITVTEPVPTSLIITAAAPEPI